MLRKENEAVLESNGPVPQQEEFGSGRPTLEEVCRMIKEALEVCNRRFDKIQEYVDDLRSMGQRVARLEPDARQPHLTMEADGPACTKTRERTEGATKAVQAMHGDSCSADRVEPDPKTNSTSFGMMAEPPDLPFTGDVLVENGAAAPKSCLPSLEMRTATVAGGLLPTGEISTATKTTFNKSPLRPYATEETNSKEKKLWTSIPSTRYDSSFWKLLAALSCRRVIETKPGQNRTFDPGGSQSRLRACPFLGTWRALLCGEVMRVGATG